MSNGSGTNHFQALADSFVVGVKSLHKKYLTLEAALGAFQGALGQDTIKLLQKD
jgi:hypothetical protein